MVDQTTSQTLFSLLDPDEMDMSVVVSDPHQPDNPMIFVSDAFEEQTGYGPEYAVGRNCRFLQGPETNPRAIEAIRHALSAQTRFVIDSVNYRKDGTKFLNRLRIRPLFDENGDILYFIGAQNPVH
ncbi:MAG: PAS domain-containing protein [Pseudomonadota bacterium]